MRCAHNSDLSRLIFPRNSLSFEGTQVKSDETIRAFCALEFFVRLKDTLSAKSAWTTKDLSVVNMHAARYRSCDG